MSVPSRLSAPLLLVAAGSSQLGNSVVAVVIPWLVLQRTGSATWAGLIAAAALVPMVLSAFFGGALVDRCGHRRSSVAADILSAVAVIAIPVADGTLGLSLPLLAALVALGAMFDGPGGAAREALRPQVAQVSGWSLTKINTRGEAVDGAAAFLGPALAGVLIATIGAITTLWVAAVCFALAAGMTQMGTPGHQYPRPVAGQSYWQDVVAGLQLVWRDRTLRRVAGLGLLLVAVIAPVEVVVWPTYFTDENTPAGLALVLGGFALGGIIGALGYGQLAQRSPQKSALPIAVGGFGGGLALMSWLPDLPWLTALAVLSGILAGPISPILAELMQQRTPAELRGRVIGTITSIALAAAPAALLIAGPFVDRVGVRGTLLALGCIGVFAMLCTSRWRLSQSRLPLEILVH